MFGTEPAARSEQDRLAALLLENEQQLETIGGNEIPQAELECLQAVLANPQDYLHFAPKRLRLNTMNVVVDESGTDRAADVDFAVAELGGTPPMRRALFWLK